MATEQQLYHKNVAISPVTDAGTVRVPRGETTETLTTSLDNITTSVGDVSTDFTVAYRSAKNR